MRKDPAQLVRGSMSMLLSIHRYKPCETIILLNDKFIQLSDTILVYSRE